MTKPCPVSATIAHHLNGDEWIVGIMNERFLKMVHLKVTGTNSYKEIETKFIENGKYPNSCLTAFTKSCFVGISLKGNYEIDLVARQIAKPTSNEGKIVAIFNNLVGRVKILVLQLDKILYC